MFAALFGSGKKFDQDINEIGVEEHPVQTSSAKKKNQGFFAVLSGSKKTVELSTNSDGMTPPNPKMSDFFATGSHGKQHLTPPRG